MVHSFEQVGCRASLSSCDVLWSLMLLLLVRDMTSVVFHVAASVVVAAGNLGGCGSKQPRWL